MRPRGARRGEAALALGLVLLAHAAIAQTGRLDETLDVRVVNVDVQVTTPDGAPARYLAREDFELRVDGEPVEVRYFEVIEDGFISGSRERAPSARYLAVVWVPSALRPKDAATLRGAVRDSLPRLIESTSGMLLARQGRGLRIEQSLTDDPARLGMAFERLTDRAMIAAASAERALLLSRLERAIGPEDVVSVDLARLARAQAEQLLREIHILARQEQSDTLARLEQLRGLTGVMGALPGRKAVLYLGAALEAQSSETLYRVWWDKYRSLVNQMDAEELQGQITQAAVAEALRALTADANRHRVTVYVAEPGSGREGTSLELGTLDASQPTGSRDSWLTLSELAARTGGLAVRGAERLPSLLDALLLDLGSYYSLGFEPRSQQQGAGRVEVRVRRPGLTVRHFERVGQERPEADLVGKVMTALLTSEAANPLELSVELGDFDRQRNGNYRIPILVKVPISRVALRPRAHRHVGELSLVVLAQSAEGELSAPERGDLPLTIDNSELLAAMSQLAGYRLEMEVSPGKQTIAIGLRDEVAQTTSTLRLTVNTDG